MTTPTDRGPARPTRAASRLARASLAAAVVLACLLAVEPTGASTPGGATGLSRLQGIDACTAPSLDTLRAFWNNTPYGDLGIYLGGVSRACAQPNLTASWVSQAVDMGWSFMPIWVGPQAPCIGRNIAMFSNDPAAAAARGQQEALGAVAAAQNLGFATGSVVYYDMEGYGDTCSPAVRAFVGGWVSGLHAAGWKAGMYGSCVNTGDFAAAAPPPDALWFAHWDNKPGPTDSSCPATQTWANDRLIKQWHGDHDETWNGVTLNVDNNCANGIVAPTAHGTLPVCALTPDKTAQMDRRIDVFARDSGGRLVHRPFAYGAWSASWEDLGGALRSAPGAVSWGPGRIDVFTRGTDDHLWHRWFSGGVWSGWQNLGGVLTSAPDAASWGSGRLDVFARGAANELIHRSYANGAWSAWESLGGVLSSAPSAASWGADRVDVFVRGGGNRLYRRWFAGGAWSGWQNLGGVLASAPDVASWGSGRLDVFLQGSDKRLWHRWFSGSAWSGWENLGGVLTSAPGAVSWGTGRIDVFVRGGGNQLYQRWYEGARWSSVWRSLGGALADDPDASAWAT